jgi:hypothetical protein
MAKRRIAVLEAHEAPGSTEPMTFCGRAIAERLVRTREARRLGNRLIQMVRAKACDAIKRAKAARDAVNTMAKIELQRIVMYHDGPIGVGNVLPFARLHNYGDKLHYEMPMAGDRTCFARHRPRNIRVSSRSLFSKQAIPVHAIPAVAIAG